MPEYTEGVADEKYRPFIISGFLFSNFFDKLRLN